MAFFLMQLIRSVSGQNHFFFKENWQKIFDMDDIKQQVRDITNKYLLIELVI